MTKFRIVTNPPKKYIDQAWVFNDDYFTIDTAERDLVDTWYEKNAETIIYALQDEIVVGFMTVIPLTAECGALFAENNMKEEDITANDILPPASMKYAQYLYVAAIAIKHRGTLSGSHCVAAMLSALCNRILRLYSKDRLVQMFVNPTTFDGNRFTNKLGLQRVRPKHQGLRAGNDIYAMTFNPETFDNLAHIELRYRRFISAAEWLEDRGTP